MTTRKKSWLWKALVGTLQRPGVTLLGSAQGGYVNVVASAVDQEEFAEKVKNALNELGLELVDLDQAEALPMSLSEASVSDEIRTMAKTVREQGSVAFGTFYVFDEKTDKNPCR